jgi:hypothetical protein
MKGCLTLPVRVIGCLGLIVLLAAGWLYRDQIVGFVKDQLSSRRATSETVGRPTQGGARRALDKVDSLNAWHADSVVLSAAEMASLIGAGLDPAFRGNLDSLQVGLSEDRIRIEASLKTSQLPRELLGPLGGMVGDREHLKAEGPVTVTAPARAEWRIDQLTLGSFPFPRDVIPRLMERALGTRTSSVPFIIPRGIADVAIHPSGVTLYSKAQ